MKNEKKKIEFSKVLLIQESVLIWLTTIAFIIMAFISIAHDYTGELAWIVALCGAIWAAYGVSQAFYYNKAKIENSRGGIKYMTVANSLGILENDNEMIDEEQQELQACADG